MHMLVPIGEFYLSLHTYMYLYTFNIVWFLFSFQEEHLDDPQWSVDEVCEWLGSIELSYLIPLFRRYEIDGRALLTLNGKDCMKMGVTVRIYVRAVNELASSGLIYYITR